MFLVNLFNKFNFPKNNLKLLKILITTNIRPEIKKKVFAFKMLKHRNFQQKIKKTRNIHAFSSINDHFFIIT